MQNEITEAAPPSPDFALSDEMIIAALREGFIYHCPNGKSVVADNEATKRLMALAADRLEALSAALTQAAEPVATAVVGGLVWHKFVNVPCDLYASPPVACAEPADIIVLRADRENLHSRVRELRSTITCLMAKLADLLDEDKFRDCEDIVRNAGIDAPANISDQAEEVARTIWLYVRGRDETPVEAGAWFDNHKHLGGPAYIIDLIRSALSARPTPPCDGRAEALEEENTRLREERDKLSRIIANLDAAETYDDSLLRDIHRRLQIHGEKYPDRMVSVLHRNVVFYKIVESIRALTQKDKADE